MSSGFNQMLNEFKKAMSKNMKRLTEMASGSLEMQQLLIQTGEKYIAEKQALEDTGSTLYAASQAKRRKKVTSHSQNDPHDIPSGIPMRRGLNVYRNWGQKLASEFVGYIEPALRNAVSALPQATLHELIEYSCDLRLRGDVLDRVGFEDKRQVFEAGRRTYQRLGSRLSSNFPVTVAIDWAAHGHFVIDFARAPQQLIVHCRLLMQSVTVGQEVLHGDTGPFNRAIVDNHSRFAASLHTDKDVYKLSGLFPRLSRSLLRRPSEVTGAAGSAVSQADADAEAKEDEDEDDPVPSPSAPMIT